MTQSPATPLPPPKERRRLREAGSLTQAQVAERVGVSRETVRSWETGRTTPRGRKREAYAKLLTSLGEEETATKPSAVETVRTVETVGVEVVEVTKAEVIEVAVAEVMVAEVKVAEAEIEVVEVEVVGDTAVIDPVLVPASSPVPVPVPVPVEEPSRAPLTPAQAFDALYAFCAPALVRQAYLLTGRRELARESVERAFQVAWQRWPEVAVDRDPAGWVRAVAYEHALSPWHRFRPRYRHPEPPPPDAADRALLTALLKLPPSYRRTLLLYDGVGLGLAETAAETEASTPAAANRLLHAREALAARLPELSDPTELHRRMTELASTGRLHAAKPPTVRFVGERRTVFWTRAAIAFTVAIIGATTFTVRVAPTRYEAPVPVGERVEGVPARVVQGSLSEEEVALRDRLRSGMTSGPERLAPLSR
ncbi:sigma factor-like helix-turn-helix DNA-binding protein [Streptomyces sp. N50]|uniref:sigma factor-like helix-turn-helix DNA-binding protein n=1 Tax=Streptomyces sp. N50 TaxID=3081765 RepID=UPI0029620829|nr:sigma factor-like helix-turn-helix DNA-binding protein [Streptomyces sp. N50]WOX11977.1 sigma factor-like helix-turn-helix DNA-binding protein [Streptomyces sp. N50]